MQTARLQLLKYPAAFLALAALILLPAFFVFANEDEEKEKCDHQGNNRPGLAVEIVSVSVSDDGSGTIQATLMRIPPEVSEEQGVDDGDTVTISVTDETKYKLGGEDASADDLAAGEEVFVAGEVSLEDLTISADFISDRPPQPKFHVGEVVEIDTSANTILVKVMRPPQQEADEEENEAEDQYVFITYSDDTVINEDGEEVDESAIEVGDRIHAEGDVNKDSDEYLAEVDADRIHLFEDETPREVKREHRQENSQSDIRE